MLRKLTKKRPSSVPVAGKGKVDPRVNNLDLGPSVAAEILPEVLFHGVWLGLHARPLCNDSHLCYVP
jgi:hypothetical protein